MSLIKRNGGFFPGLRTRLPELFDIDNFFETPLIAEKWHPAVNVRENDDNFEIEVAAPGLTKKDFRVAIENNILTIACEKEEEQEDTRQNYTFREFNYRSFSRSFNLPESVNQDKIKAAYKDGILKIHLNKTEKAVHEKSREISVS